MGDCRRDSGSRIHSCIFTHIDGPESGCDLALNTVPKMGGKERERERERCVYIYIHTHMHTYAPYIAGDPFCDWNPMKYVLILDPCLDESIRTTTMYRQRLLRAAGPSSPV